jgi:hypothetical protein
MLILVFWVATFCEFVDRYRRFWEKILPPSLEQMIFCLGRAIDFPKIFFLVIPFTYEFQDGYTAATIASFFLHPMSSSCHLTELEMTSTKLKLSHYTPRRRLGERSYSSYSFSTSALDGGEWSALRPGRALSPGKRPPVPIVQEAGWAPEPVWTERIEEIPFASAGGRTLFVRSSSP